jgi:hypothetical protein
MGPDDGSNQRGHRARFALRGIGKYEPNLSSTPPKLSILFEGNEIFGVGLRAVDLLSLAI